MIKLTEKDIQETILRIKESQERAKGISDVIRKSLIVSTEVLRGPYTI